MPMKFPTNIVVTISDLYREKFSIPIGGKDEREKKKARG